MRQALMAAILVLVLTMPVCAVDVQARQAEIFDTAGLAGGVPDEAREVLGDADPLDTGTWQEGVTEILQNAADASDGYLKSGLRSAGIVLAIVVLCAMADKLDLTADSRAATLAGALGITVACTADLHSLIRLGEQTIDEIAAFTNLLLPTMAAAATASGGAVSGAAIYVATAFFTDVLIGIVDKVLIPLVYAYVAICCADAAVGDEALARLAGFLKWSMTTALKFLLVIFTGYLTITGVVSGSADAATIKAAKLTLSTVVPVVGSILSDASETVLVSAGLLKNSIGLFGMLATLAICVLPFARLGIQYLLLKLTAAAAGMVGAKAHGRLVDNLGAAMGLLLAMTGASALMLLISCVCSMKAVTV